MKLLTADAESFSKKADGWMISLAENHFGGGGGLVYLNYLETVSSTV